MIKFRKNKSGNIYPIKIVEKKNSRYKVRYEIKKRTFEAKKYPKGSEKRKELNKDHLTSEYNPTEKYYVYKNGVFEDGYPSRTKAERAIEIQKEYGG